MPVPLDNSSVLLIPGPVSLPLSTRLTMLEDHAAREREMVEGLRYVRRYLVKLANAEGIGTAIPLPGSATYANEAMIRTFVPKTGKRAWKFNQAIMELGALVCKARAPQCNECPVQPVCKTGRRLGARQTSRRRDG